MANKRIPITELDARIAELEELKARKEAFDAMSPEQKIVEHLMDKLIAAYDHSVWGVHYDEWGGNDNSENRVDFSQKVAILAETVGTNDYETLYNILKLTNIL